MQGGEGGDEEEEDEGNVSVEGKGQRSRFQFPEDDLVLIQTERFRWPSELQDFKPSGPVSPEPEWACLSAL